jgi:hypothetical protein
MWSIMTHIFRSCMWSIMTHIFRNCMWSIMTHIFRNCMWSIMTHISRNCITRDAYLAISTLKFAKGLYGFCSSNYKILGQIQGHLRRYAHTMIHFNFIVAIMLWLYSYGIYVSLLTTYSYGIYVSLLTTYDPESALIFYNYWSKTHTNL